MAYKLTHEDSEIFKDFMSKKQQFEYHRADRQDYNEMVFEFYLKHNMRTVINIIGCGNKRSAK
jgi:hypothetical protein